jgi:YD repeat-containing protein
MRNLIFPLSLFFACFRLSAQVSDTRTIAPPSPNIASLLKFTEVPVSKYTGLPETSIPVYTIHAKDIDLPVVLQYHSGGVRVTEAASWVGMGWALSFGGVITQNIRGNRDDWQHGRFNSEGVDKVSPTLCDLYKLVTGVKDGEPDMYSFSFNGISGSFILDDDKNIVQIPEQKLKIEPVVLLNNIVPYEILSWKVTDQKGIQYFFQEKETVTTQMDLSSGPNISMDNHPVASQLSWYVSKIKGPSGDSITFSYDTYNSLDYIFSSESKRFLYDVYGVPQGTESSVTYQMQNVYPGKRIHSITFDEGRVEFTTGGNRCDLSGDKYLGKIDVYNYNNQRIRELALNYKYFVGRSVYNPGDIDCSSEPGPIIEIPGSSAHNNYKDRRLFLTSVDEVDSSNAIVDSYTFEYENSAGLPNRFSTQQDMWGLYNGNNQTSLLQNLNQLQDGNYDILGRDANLLCSTQGVLKKITYPTGGYTQFDFELNSIPYSFTPTYVVHPQESYTASGQDTGQFLGNLTINDFTGSMTIGFQVQRCVFGPTGTPAAGFYIKDINGNVVVTGQQVTAANQQTGNGKFSLTLPNGYYKIYSYAIALLPCTYTVTVYQWIDQPPNTTADYAYGGLRVKRTTSYDPVGNTTLIDTLDYSMVSGGVKMSSGSCSITLDRTKNNFNTYRSTGLNTCGNPTGLACGEYTVRVLNVVSNTNYPLGTNQNGYVGYAQVKTQHLDGKGNDLGYTLNQFLTEPADKTMDYAMQVGNGAIVNPNFITTHSLDPAYSYSWARGKMLKDYQFVNAGGNTYLPVHKEDYYYSPLYTTASVKAVGTYYLFPSSYPAWDTCSTRPRDDAYAYTPYQVWSGYQFLDSVVTQDIDNAFHVLKTTTSYVYDTSNFLPSRVSVTNSRNEITASNLKYPMDYIINGTPGDNAAQGIQTLQNLHVISPVIEKYVQRANNDGSNQRTLSAVLNTYKPVNPVLDSVYNWEPLQRSSGFTPFAIGAGSTKDASYKAKISFDNYDTHGNVAQQRKVNDAYLSYVWDYHAYYPVAEIKNAPVDQVAYTSFEADGTGSWTIGSTARDTTAGVTGGSSYVLNSDISRSGLAAGTTYIISYWTRNNTPFTIAGTVAGYPIQGRTVTINGVGWTYYEHKITGQTSITVMGSGSLDELRLYPDGAQMTTYTYIPLMGMSAQCDVNNRIIYYEYDGLARLKVIRDQDGNIIKTIKYHYQWY